MRYLRNPVTHRASSYLGLKLDKFRKGRSVKDVDKGYLKSKIKVKSKVDNLKRVLDRSKKSETETGFFSTVERERLYRKASRLALITIFYNIFEGLFSVYFGIDDETLALFGFGVDSFVETLSGLGIYRMAKAQTVGKEAMDKSEGSALRVTATAFFLLSAGLFLSAGMNIYARKAPESTILGILVSLISMATMWFLMRAKLQVGRKLGSEAIVADAYCTRACFYLSFVLFTSSFIYEVFDVWYIDSIGAIWIAIHALREGTEALKKSRIRQKRTKEILS